MIDEMWVEEFYTDENMGRSVKVIPQNGLVKPIRGTTMKHEATLNFRKKNQDKEGIDNIEIQCTCGKYHKVKS